MSAIRHLPNFDHGAALRVPPLHDARGRRALWLWLGAAGEPFDDRGAVQVATAGGAMIARPGDWIVLSVSGAFHVARSGPFLDA
jgi:hypothetical protein